MTELAELIHRLPEKPRVVLGRAANTITTPDDDLFVTVGAFDGHRARWGPLEWAPANAMPARGDDVLVMFDEDETPWGLVFTWGSRTVAGVADSTPATPSSPLYVKVDGVRIGPCQWSPRNALPKIGDSVLVEYDDDGTPWVTVVSVGNRIAPGVADSNISVPTDSLYVKVDGVRFGPMLWTPRDTTPKIGDQVLVNFDEDGKAWASTTSLIPPPVIPTPPSPATLLLHLEQNAVQSVTSTSESTPNTVIGPSPNVACDGGAVLIEYFAPDCNYNIGPVNLTLLLFRDGVSTGRLALFYNPNDQPIYAAKRETPSAGNHQWSVRAFVSTGQANIYAGGGGAGNYVPAYLRVSKDVLAS